MTENDLEYFRNWFSAFCRSYYRADKKEQSNILLKEKHSRFVAGNCRLIAEGEAFHPNETMIAEVAGLFHDVGRFPQYAIYKTFLDKVSVNHGQLGADTLSAEKVLSRLPRKESAIIENAVRFHNAFSIPGAIESDSLVVLKVVRDSDKIDIWRVFCEQFESSDEEKADAAVHGLPDAPKWSQDVIASILSKKTVRLADVKTLNDFKLLQLSWVFDLNFRTSFRMIEETGIIERFSAFLPKDSEISAALKVIKEHISEKGSEFV